MVQKYVESLETEKNQELIDIIRSILGAITKAAQGRHTLLQQSEFNDFATDYSRDLKQMAPFDSVFGCWQLLNALKERCSQADCGDFIVVLDK